MIIANGDFSGVFTSGMPASWAKSNPVIGVNASTVTTLQTNGVAEVISGSAVRVTTDSPMAGIQQKFTVPGTVAGKISAKVRVAQGQAMLTVAGLDGTNPYMSKTALPKGGFTSSRGWVGFRSKFGAKDYLEFCTLANTAENVAAGAVYCYRNQAVAGSKVREVAGVGQLMSSILELPNKEIIFYHKIDGEVAPYNNCRPWMMTSTDGFNTIDSDVQVMPAEDTLTAREKIQVYGTAYIPLKNLVVVPFVKYDGTKYWLDVWTSNDQMNTRKVQANQRITLPAYTGNRGMLEPRCAIMSDGNVAILCRTDEGHIAKAIFNVKTMLLEPTITFLDFATASTAFSIMPLPDDTGYAIAWNAGIINRANSSYPRNILCLGFTDKDLNNINNIQIISTNAVDAVTMLNGSGSDGHCVPYIHSPIISYDSSNTNVIHVYYEVITGEVNTDYCIRKSGSLSTLNRPGQKTVTTGTGSFETLTINMPAGTFLLQILSGIDSVSSSGLSATASKVNSVFSVDNIVDTI